MTSWRPSPCRSSHHIIHMTPMSTVVESRATAPSAQLPLHRRRRARRSQPDPPPLDQLTETALSCSTSRSPHVGNPNSCNDSPPFAPCGSFQVYAQKLAKETVTLMKPVTPRGRILDIYNPKRSSLYQVEKKEHRKDLTQSQRGHPCTETS